jgi:hypothetical protein
MFSIHSRYTLSSGPAQTDRPSAPPRWPGRPAASSGQTTAARAAAPPRCATVAVPHGMLVPRSSRSARGLKVLQDLLAALEAVQPRVRAGLGVHGTAAVVITLIGVRLCRWPICKIVRIVRRRHLDQSGAERRVHKVVGDHRNLAVQHGQQTVVLPDQAGYRSSLGSPPPPHRPAGFRGGWWPQ